MDIAIGVDSIKIDLAIPTALLPVCPGACTPCPAGSKQPNLGATRCTVCSTGTYQPFEGRAACGLCAARTTSVTPFTACNECDAGTVSI